MKRIIMIALALIAVLALMGCGTSDEVKYALKVNDLQQAAGQKLVDQGQAITVDSAAEADTQIIREQGKTIIRLSDQVRGISEVPDSLKQENTRLAEELNNLGAAIENT